MSYFSQSLQKAKSMRSINPFTQELISEFKEHSEQEVNNIITSTLQDWELWKNTSFDFRSEKMIKAASVLRRKKEELAQLITTEMGKRISEARAEIEKCAWVCEYYAEHAAQMLADETIISDASVSKAVFHPLGPILAVMPWNYPLWQVIRFAAPALMAGNAALLKHASNVQGCAIVIERVFREAGFPENLFRTLIIPSSKVEKVIANPAVKAVTLTGSEAAGSKVAMTAGKYLKKTVLELGGSDPYIVLEDADLDEAAKIGVQSRMLTTGQTCISAKRFIVMESIAQKFQEKILNLLTEYQPGNPLKEETTLAPLARPDLAESLKWQVKESIRMGAKKLFEGDVDPANPNFFPPTLLTEVTPKMPVFNQETFGPVFAMICVKNEEEAIEMANQSNYGLGASIWTRDPKKGEKIALKLDVGATFINGLVKSDPRLPFGGIKLSGYGRELSSYGIKEFVNIKSVWIK